MSESTVQSVRSTGAIPRIRALLRLVLIVLVTLVVGLLLLIVRILLTVVPTLKRRARATFFRIWSSSVCRLLGGRTSVHGSLPSVQCMIASNHLSYLDILVIAQHAPAVFVSKADVKRWPVINWLTALADTIYIERERIRDIPAANRAITDAINKGDNVVVFPEGTSSDSEWVLPVRPPLLQSAIDLGTPVTTAAIRYTTHADDTTAAQSICYYGDMNFMRHIWRLMQLRGWQCDLRFSGAVLQANDRKTLALNVRRSILQLQNANKPASPMPDYRQSYAFKKYQ